MKTIAVTGAFGYSGKAIAEQLIARGDRVCTLTNSPNRPHNFGNTIEVHPLAFNDLAQLTNSLRGCDILINTYWVRFNHRLFTFDQAIRNTRQLFAAAKAAGVSRIIHTSILKPEQGNGLAYYEGKLALERDLESTGLPHSIMRPGVLFGRGDILVNNIAWVLRHMPIFGVFGKGQYALAPLHVEDFATISLRAVDADPTLPRTIDCHGPEMFPYGDLVKHISNIISIKRPIISIPPSLGYLISKMLNPFVGDVIITREEIEGLMRGLLWSDKPSLGTTSLTKWATTHRESLGRRYASEVGRRKKRDMEYQKI